MVNEHRKRLTQLQDRLTHQMIMLKVDEKNVELGESRIEILKQDILECEQLIEERKQNGRKTKKESAADSR